MAATRWSPDSVMPLMMWPLAQVQCHESPIPGVFEETSSANQRNGDPRWEEPEPGGPGTRPLSRDAAPCCSWQAHSAQSHLPGVSSARDTASRPPEGEGEQGTCTGRAREELASVDRSPCPEVPAPDWAVVMQKRTPNLHSLIGPKGAVQIGRNRATLIGQKCAALIGWGKPQSCCLKWDSRNSFLRAGLAQVVGTRCRLLPEFASEAPVQKWLTLLKN